MKGWRQGHGRHPLGKVGPGSRGRRASPFSRRGRLTLAGVCVADGQQRSVEPVDEVPPETLRPVALRIDRRCGGLTAPPDERSTIEPTPTAVTYTMTYSDELQRVAGTYPVPLVCRQFLFERTR